jgi:hypothetical protein
MPPLRVHGESQTGAAGQTFLGVGALLLISYYN